MLMERSGRLSGLVAALVGAAGMALLAQTPPAGSATGQRPDFRAGASAVRVDVRVTDRQGQPVTSLRESDFEVLEDNARQSIESFKLITLPLATAFTGTPSPIRSLADEDREASRDDVRTVAVFLDDYHLRQINAMGARTSLVRFIRDDLSPNDLLAVMSPLTAIDAVRFTRDREAVVRTLERFQGRKYDHALKNEFEVPYSQCPPATIERVRRQVTLDALKSLVRRMGSLGESRKTILFFSEGFGPTPLIPAGPLVQPRGDPDAPVCRSLAGSDSPPQFRADLHDLAVEAARSNVVIVPFDPRGSGTTEFQIDEKMSSSQDAQALRDSRETLQVLADDTDGRLVLKPDDREQGLQRIIRDSRVYYLIGYTSATPADGKFHAIRVRVKSGDFVVRARQGYWASKVEAARPDTGGAPAPSGVNAALAALVQSSGGRFVRSWTGAGRDESGRTRVTFVSEPIDSTQRLSVSLLAASDATTYFQGAVGADSASVSRVAFDAPPGPIQLVVTARNGDGSVVDKMVQEFVVPDLSGASLTLSTPMLLRAGTPQEWTRLNQGADAVPTAAREFRRGDRLLVRFAMHGSPGASSSARILDRRGARLSELTVKSVGATSALQVEVPLGSLALADYVLELSAAGDRDQRANQWVAFRVRN